jgi:hypothetical protein
MKKLALILLLAVLLIAPAISNASAAIGGGLSATTNPATGVTGTTAMLHGATSTGGTAGEPVKVWFNYGSSGMLTSSTPPQSFALPPASFSATISSLTPGLTYSFQAVVMPDLIGSTPIPGNVLNFTTTPTPPTQVATYPATSISASGATLNGNLSSLGDQASSGVGFEWGASAAYGNTTSLQTRSAPGGFSFNLSSLAPGIYHYRAFATVHGGSAQPVLGADEVFQIVGPTVSVVTLGVSGITTTSANPTGHLNTMGGFTSVQVWFEWGTNSFTQSSPTQNLAVAESFAATITGLGPNDTYIYRAAARPNAIGANTVFGEARTFTTPAAPALAVQTRNASSIRSTAANLNGTVLSLGTASLVQVAFDWGATTSYGNTTNLQNLSSASAFNATLTGLAPNTVYHFRAVVRTPDNIAYGGDLTLVTADSPAPGPTVETASATDLKATTATLNGNLGAVGSYGPVRAWFEYGRDTGYGAVTPPSNLSGPGPFSAAVSGLQANMVYYYRAASQPVSGGALAYGAAMNFTTPAQPAPAPTPTTPAVTATGAANLTSVSASLGGSLASLGSAGSVQVYFEWGPSIAYGNTTPMQIRTAAGAFTAGIAGLTPGATYHYRVVAIAQGGDGKPVYSTDMAFATTPKSGC